MTVYALSVGIHGPISHILPGHLLGSLCFFSSDGAHELCSIDGAGANRRSNGQEKVQISFVVNSKWLHERFIAYVRLSQPVLREYRLLLRPHEVTNTVSSRLIVC